MARLAQISWPRGAETRQRPYMVRAGDRYKIGRCEGEVSIALVSVLDIMPLAVIYTVIYVYGKWLRVKYFIGWLRLSGYIQKTYSFSSICILRGGAVV